MRLTALQPCSFGGKRFLIGEEIPVELVANPKALEKMGRIAIASNTDNAETPTGLFNVPIHANNGVVTLNISNADLNVFTEVRQIGVNSAEDKQKISALIQNINSDDLLIMLDALDGRKFVKEEAQARAKALQEQTEQGEQTGGGN